MTTDEFDGGLRGKLTCRADTQVKFRVGPAGAPLSAGGIAPSFVHSFYVSRTSRAALATGPPRRTYGSGRPVNRGLKGVGRRRGTPSGVRSPSEHWRCAIAIGASVRDSSAFT
jgi:hypothetical protein